MRVKFLESERWWELEGMINKMLLNVPDDEEIVDIKLCAETNHPAYSHDSNIAMIIYRKKRGVQDEA